ncbi:hypothetical protein KCU81_g5564, partial [Aureobasidium melanogenum]|uniref:Helicase C-terminal domain-containing protein n=1 Tax=Aureobasidium melanogenum (strain CBS 110374) TaxID=1043003 RepID=A0A074W0E6_AURM1
MSDGSNDDPDPIIPLHTTPKATPRLPAPVSPEAAHFLNDLRNYVPIGSLVLNGASGAEPAWEEVQVNHLATLTDSGLSDQNALDVEKLLARRRIRAFASIPWKSVLRIYVLPSDVGHRFLQQDRGLDTHLFSLIRNLDVSPSAWNGQPAVQKSFEMYATGEEGSLYYLFNNIPSPNPTPEAITSHFHRESMLDLLDPEYQLPGLKTVLYPYQRRSAAQMLQRECEDKLELDPRLEKRIALDGSTYYYEPWDVSFLRSPRFYESCKGGILAETMGLGKTLICLTLILATRGYLPRTPAQYDRVIVRPKVVSLLDMAISAVNRHSAPWPSFFERHEELTGEHMGHCIDLMRQNAPSYEIPIEPIRWNRKTTVPAPKKVTLAATTLVVVPRNLLSQWKSELEKHTSGVLKTLVMDDTRVNLPPPEILASFDLVLFSRPRFEYEDRDGADQNGRRMSRYPPSCTCPYIGATRTRDCVCIRPDDIYVSPLKSLHFLRIIIDEGHGMATENTRIATVASKLVEASHRWIVSGTPAKDLIGVELDLVGPVSHSESLRRETLLRQRKAYSVKDEKDGAVRSIGSMASNFLRIRPWCSAEDERGSDWANYFFRHEMLRPRSRTFSGFSRCLRQTLESIVIRTQSGDVERDIELPPLTHEIVRLEPSFYDKLTVNAFVFVLTANAVTSERTDVDYIFHKNSVKERTQLLNNLRASAFYWTGFSASDMEAAIEQSEGYIKKPTKLCSKEDESLLRRCIDQARVMISSEGWKKLTQSHEVGLFVEDWPAESAAFWSFDRADSSTAQVLCGATQLIQAQDHVNRQAELLDPAEGLAGTGIKALSFLQAQSDEKTPVLVKAGIPSSSLALNQTGSKRTPASPQTKPESHKRKSPVGPPETQSHLRDAQLPANSALSKTSIVGTTSAKLSYLLSRIEEFYRDEKILVFYDNDNTAYYIAQALEVLHVDYLIYAKSLTPAVKSDYIVRFNQRPEHRVLLMDIGQAAFGLNFPSASRVFFINPVNRPQVEAQALKRAHRIGQTREVHAETLILKGTIEEKVFERARTMSRAEHKNAKELDDDGGIREIIQSAQPIPVHEATGAGRIAFIERPQQLFARPGWAGWKIAARENSSKARTKTSQKRKAENANGKSPSRKRAKKQK